MAWTNPIDYSVGQNTCVAKIDEQILTNIDFAGSHTHSGEAGDGALILASGSSIQGTNTDQVVYRYITLIPAIVSEGNAPVLNGFPTGHYFNGGGYNFSSGSAGYYVDLDIGTWTFDFYYIKGAQAGKLNACIGGASLGNFDMGGTTNASPLLAPASTFSISASGVKTLKFSQTTGSSGANTACIMHFELRRISD